MSFLKKFSQILKPHPDQYRMAPNLLERFEPADERALALLQALCQFRLLHRISLCFLILSASFFYTLKNHPVIHGTGDIKEVSLSCFCLYIQKWACFHSILVPYARIADVRLVEAENGREVAIGEKRFMGEVFEKVLLIYDDNGVDRTLELRMSMAADIYRNSKLCRNMQEYVASKLKKIP